MIVQCDRCQTRFRLPDSAVGDKGAKARCSRCGNVFIVEKPPEPETSSATVPPPANYSGLTVATAGLPEVAAPPIRERGFELEPESPPTTRTELPSFGAAPPAARPPPPSSTALGAFAPSSGGPSGLASLPPPPSAPETSSPELSADQFFDIPPPSLSPPAAPEAPAFDGPAFGRTAEVSKFSRADFTSFPPLDLHSGPPPPAQPKPSSARSPKDEIPSVPSLVGPAEAMSWGVHEEDTRRVEPSELPDLDHLPDAPAASSSWHSLRETAERDPLELQSALELGRAAPSAPPAPRPQRPVTAGPTTRLPVGRLEAMATSTLDVEPPGPESLPARELPAWSVEALSLLVALLLSAPLLHAAQDQSSPLRPLIEFLTSTSGPIDPAALREVHAEGVRVLGAVGPEGGVVVHGRIVNPTARELADAEVLVHALDGDRLVRTQRQPLSSPPTPEKPLEFAVVFPGTAAEYRPLRFRVEVAPARAAPPSP